MFEREPTFCERCSAVIELDEADEIFANSIGVDAYAPTTGWLCAECAEWEAREDERWAAEQPSSGPGWLG